MIYLLLAILCSSSIALIFKYSEGKGLNRYVVTTSNYFLAFTVSLIMIFSKGLLKGSNLSLTSFSYEFQSLINGSQNLFSPSSSIIWAILCGVPAGAFFFLSFIYYQKSVKENGASLSGTFGKLGILIPMIFSVILWNEIPTIIQWIGIILSIISILLVNISFNEKVKNFNVILILLFLFGGFAEFSNKIFQKYALSDYKDVFLFFVFFIAFIISFIFSTKKGISFSKKDILIGFLVGIPNLFSSYFLIMALNYINTSVAFPIYSAGSIVFISLASFIFFKENLSKKNMLSIILTLIALVLINM